MHGRNLTLAVGLSALLVMGCASSPPKPPAPVADSTAGSPRPNAHETFFANMLAAIAAMGGTNLNSAYRVIKPPPNPIR